jgi:uncharacterized RDD family membrane protein YckC
VLHALLGQTIGKMSVRLRVLDVEGAPISWGRALTFYSNG